MTKNSPKFQKFWVFSKIYFKNKKIFFLVLKLTFFNFFANSKNLNNNTPAPVIQLPKNRFFLLYFGQTKKFFKKYLSFSPLWCFCLIQGTKVTDKKETFLLIKTEKKLWPKKIWKSQFLTPKTTHLKGAVVQNECDLGGFWVKTSLLMKFGQNWSWALNYPFYSRVAH